MKSLLKVEQAIVVEGKYDKIKLESIIDATIVVTNGYGIFKDREKLELIRFYARKKGIIILTDSDGAGFKIRGFLKGSVPEGSIKNVYIPDIFGKEKRKVKPSAEGKLGVEGIKKELIVEAFRKAGINFVSEEGAEKTERNPVTRTDIYEAGLTGTPDSSEKRKKLLKKLGLPERLSTSGMLEALNTMMSAEEFYEMMNKEKENS
ncbi:MAG: toprim domain-containing protein [Oscillospiraceae bacterium]